jgi:hypothetical protein
MVCLKLENGSQVFPEVVNLMTILNAVEARVLGSLVEKETSTPEYYPLSLNALVNACNQKHNREPVNGLNVRLCAPRTSSQPSDSAGQTRISGMGRESPLKRATPGRDADRNS